MKKIELEGWLKGYLELDYHIVGVKLHKKQENFNQSSAIQRDNQSFYCYLVKKAAEGSHRKADLSNFACETSAKLLGLDAFYEREEGIDGWLDSGLYENRKLAEQEHEAVFPVEAPFIGVEVGPIHQLSEDPDVVIIVCKPYQSMRLVQGYSFHHGYKKNFQMSGMCGVCFESTVLPLTNNEFSMSLLCSGTRFVSQWPEEMMMVSFPYSMAEKIVEGVIATGQRCESDPYKGKIEDRLNQNHRATPDSLRAKRAYFYSKDS